jgi:DNA invertase Pin-like site-specific DNA recombinase
LGRGRRTAAREACRARGQAIGRPKALDNSKSELARRMHASGEPASTIAATLGVSRATVYRAARRTGITRRTPLIMRVALFVMWTFVCVGLF